MSARGSAGRVWVLGAADPEMEAIESLLLGCGERVEHAMVLDRGAWRRARPDEVDGQKHRYVAIGASDLRAAAFHAICVECRPTILYGGEHDGIDWAGWVTTLDHHAPGDPGYGRPPAEYLTASSIGQVIALMGLEVTQEWRLVAAADHCLGAAYRGECPGVDPDELMRWRIASRAAFQRRDPAAVLADVEGTRSALRAAPRIELESACNGCARDPLTVADMRGETPWAELPEAAAREHTAYVSGPLIGSDGGRRKYTCAGPPEVVRAWMDIWAPRQGLSDIYGDPARGFAGAYDDGAAIASAHAVADHVKARREKADV